jgi:aspartyl-tRNA synthetase
MSELNASMIGQRVLLRGSWHNCRGTSKNAFILFREGRTMMQAVCSVDNPLVSRAMVKFCTALAKESVVDLVGELVASELTSEALTYRTFELRVDRAMVVSEAKAKLPFSLDDAARPEESADLEAEGETPLPRVALDTRLNARVFDLRTTTNQAVFRVLSGVETLFAEYLRERAFTRIFTPKIIPAASEGGANVFKVSYFKTEAFLAQSPQFYKQMAICGGLGRVYEVAPVFRAENSFTHRHMTEFISLDLEMAFKGHYHEVLRLIADLVVFILRELPRRFPAETAVIKAQYPSPDFVVPEGAPLVLEFPQGVAMLREAGVEIGDFEDLSTEKERRLGQLVRERYGTDFYVLDKFPAAVRPFYTMPDPERPGYSHGYDFFVRGEEILSGAQRVHCPEMLAERARACGVDPASIEDYIGAFRYGAPPHAGGAIGLERIVMLYYDLKNIRKTSMFPRDPRRVSP